MIQRKTESCPTGNIYPVGQPISDKDLSADQPATMLAVSLKMPYFVPLLSEI